MSNRQLQELSTQTSAGTTDLVPISDNASGQLKHISVANLLSGEASINLPDASEVTISSGAVTLTQSAHTVDTESDAASDDLDTINFPSGVDLALLYRENASRAVVLKHGTGNIVTGNGSDVTIPANSFVLAHKSGSFVHIPEPGPHSHAASDVTSGTLAHERGGLEADVSAYAGVVLINGGSTSEIKYNVAASTAPTTGDDSGDGYVVGSRWIDTTNDKEYVCLDNTSSAAVWTETTASASGESNTASNVGSGAGVWKQKTSVDLEFRSIVGGTGLSSTQNTNDVTLDMDISGLTAESSMDGAADYVVVYDASVGAHRKVLLNNLPSSGAGESNTASNVGSGSGIWKQKSGVDLEFKSIVAGQGIGVTGNTNDVTLGLSISTLGTTTIDSSDLLAIYDSSAGAHKQVTVAELPGFNIADLTNVSAITQDEDSIPWYDSSSGSTYRVLFEQAPFAQLRDNNEIAIPSLADSAAENESLYYSTTQSKLVYKDSSGTVNDLY